MDEATSTWLDEFLSDSAPHVKNIRICDIPITELTREQLLLALTDAVRREIHSNACHARDFRMLAR